MTFYMLSSPTDGLTRLVRTVLPRASGEVLSKLQVRGLVSSLYPLTADGGRK